VLERCHSFVVPPDFGYSTQNLRKIDRIEVSVSFIDAVSLICDQVQLQYIHQNKPNGYTSTTFLCGGTIRQVAFENIRSQATFQRFNTVADMA